MDLCYFCGSPATSKEHVPPKSFFPKGGRRGYRRNLIKVPSCDAHNSLKSKDDEYVRALLVGISKRINEGGDKGLVLLRDSVIRSMTRNPNLISLVIRNPSPPLSFGSGEVPTIPVSSEYDLERVENFLKSIAKGVFFHHYKEVWRGEVDVIPHFLIPESATAEEKNFSKRLVSLMREKISSGENKEIFYYELSDFNAEDGPRYSIDFCLYKEFNVSCIFYYG
ncbi:hypothetical protein [Chromohalobacter nigrandesensis]|uniref:hypothetical protein n=1 Tax=Chromohalobacter nigrandesensis TaxID=119863 RepID=UPI001FF6087A|nr:hypothetical protein [Chromohalobacter nigrandesensis]MCK0745462.1 hypothetical protein [Chromohalobacter nigrandesensis]